jgi:hypothetical protein
LTEQFDPFASGRSAKIAIAGCKRHRQTNREIEVGRVISSQFMALGQELQPRQVFDQRRRIDLKIERAELDQKIFWPGQR